MKQFIALSTGAFLCAALLMQGCSFSFSGGTTHVVKGQDKISVTAARPEAPKPPPPPPKPKPKKAKVVGKKIEITEKVMFEYNKAAISESSNDLLNDVAEVMTTSPKVKKVSIEGHTDGDGTAKYNKDLSQKRADAVKAYLVAAGVEDSRLEAIGFGEDKPIADNDSDAGKEKNRRVEFNIVEQEQ